MPPGLSFDPATRTFSGTPEEVLGRSEFTYRVTDARGRQDAIQDFAVVIATIGFAETIPDQTYAVTVPLATGSGADALPYVQFPAVVVGGNPPFRYTLRPAVPPGLNFDESTRRLSGTPTDIIIIAPRHTYRVTDSENTIAELTFDITVEEPVPYFPPAIVAFNYEETYSVGEDITPLILADALGGSGARSTLTYSLSLNRDGSGGLPDGLTFDAGTQTLSGRPTTGQVQTTYFYVATDVDGNRSSALNVDIRIEGAGADNVPAFADGAAIADQTYTITQAIPTLVLPQATGGDGALTYTLTLAADGGDIPAGLTFDAVNQSLSGTPTGLQAAAEYAYTVTDSDATDPDSVTLNFRIAVRAVSVIAFSDATTGGVIEGDPLEDTDTDTLAITNQGSGGTDFVVQTDQPSAYGAFSITAAGVWTYTLDNDNPAIIALARDATLVDTFTVAAAANPSATQVITITITGANGPPAIVLEVDGQDRPVRGGRVTLSVDEGAMVTLNAGGSSDPEGSTQLDYAWAHTPPQIVTFDPADGRAPMVTFMAPEERTTLNFDLTVTDDGTPQRMATAVVTVRVGRSSERALEKTLAAFGRAFAADAVDMISNHLGGFGTSADASRLTLGGREIMWGGAEGADAAAHSLHSSGPLRKQSDPWNLWEDDEAEAEINYMSTRSLLEKSAFHYALSDADGARSARSVWGRATLGNFEGKPDNFTLDGNLSSAYLGLDFHAGEQRQAGVAISYTEGDVDYTDNNANNNSTGNLDAELTSVLPYMQWTTASGLETWGLLGYGQGDATLREDGDPTETDIEMRLAAGGVRGALWSLQHSELAWKASAFAVGMESESVAELPSVNAASQRLRVAIEKRAKAGRHVSEPVRLASTWELGLRWDGGDAETGVGADLGLNLHYTNPENGWQVQAQGRYLVLHKERDYEEWSASVEARRDLGSWFGKGRGLALTLKPDWNQRESSQRLGLDFSNLINGKWTTHDLRLEVYGERRQRKDDVPGHEVGLSGELRF